MSHFERTSYEERQRKMILERHIIYSELLLLGRDKLEDKNWDETYFDLIALWLTAFNGGLLPQRGIFNMQHDNLMLSLNDALHGNGAIFAGVVEKAKELGINNYLDAYFEGVPIDDIVGR